MARSAITQAGLRAPSQPEVALLLSFWCCAHNSLARRLQSSGRSLARNRRRSPPGKLACLRAWFS
jgi:hypothetical protein